MAKAKRANASTASKMEGKATITNVDARQTTNGADDRKREDTKLKSESVSF